MNSPSPHTAVLLLENKPSFQSTTFPWYEQSSLVKEAIQVSIRAHSAQFRLSGKPYISHIENVLIGSKWLAEKLQESLTEDDVIVALLHDVLEDHIEYFDEIYETFGYDITRRIVSLSKPSRPLFEKWKEIISIHRIDVSKDLVYQYWEILFSDSNNPVDQFDNILRILPQNISYKTGTYYYTQWFSQCSLMVREILSDQWLSAIQKVKKIEKKWKEFFASIGLFFLDRKDFIIKSSDKIDNLTDTQYLTNTSSLDLWEQEQRKKKQASILRTVAIYRFLMGAHRFSAIAPEFEAAVTKSRTRNIA